MEKQFIPFAQYPARRGVAPKLNGRRNHMRSFANVCYKEDGPPGETPEQKTAREALMKSVADQFNEELTKRGFLTKEQVEKEIQERMKAFDGITPEAIRVFNENKGSTEKTIGELRTALEKQGLEMKAIKDAQHGAIPDRKTIAGEIRAAIEKNKEGFEAFKRGESRSFGTDAKGNSSIQLGGIRASITMSVGSSTGSSAFVPNVEVQPGLIDLHRNQPFIEGYSNTSSTSSARIVWTEKFNPQGNAAFIGEGQLKPLISFEIRTLESYAKKVADKIKVSTEMLDDIDFIAGEIENELRYKVDIAVDSSLLTGAGDGSNSATDLKGLTAYVGGYVLSNIKTGTPNNFDAIRSAAAQIISLNFSASIVFVNTIDGANMDLVKDSQGRPLAMQYKDDQGKIYRLTIVETNQMPVGSVLVGDMSRFKVRNYQPFSVAYGWVYDDFEKNLVTIIGERRLHAFVAANDAGAFVYDTFANIKTAITAP